MTSPAFRRRRTAPALTALTVLATVLAGCGGGASDVPGGDNPDAETTLRVVAFAVPEPGWSSIIPAFSATPEGKGIEVSASYGASADQSRAVAEGKPADLVNLSAEPDITRLVKAGKVPRDWGAGVTRGVPFGSVVTLVVREGNPDNIRDWDDLLRPGIEVVTPSPLSSGSAKWNLLAPYAAKSDGGRDQQAGLNFVSRLVGDHVRVRPGSAREATDVFLQGTGDVLLSYESEAIAVERQGKPVEHVNPLQTIRVESPVAVVATTPHLDAAVALRNFLFTPQGQQIWAQAGFRPVDPAVAAEFAAEYPVPQKLWTVADLGGWTTTDAALFDSDTGAITMIYKEATG